MAELIYASELGFSTSNSDNSGAINDAIAAATAAVRATILLDGTGTFPCLTPIVINPNNSNCAIGIVGLGMGQTNLTFNAAVDYLRVGSNTPSAEVAVSNSASSATTVTISVGSPAVVTWTGHGKSENDPLNFTTDDSLPKENISSTDLAVGRTYFVKTVLSANTFTISSTPGGDAINTTVAGSGTHTGRTPGIVTWTAHGKLVNDPVGFATSSVLPGGLAQDLTYFVKQVVSANTFTVSATAGGDAINTTSTGTGKQVCGPPRTRNVIVRDFGFVSNVAQTTGCAVRLENARNFLFERLFFQGARQAFVIGGNALGGLVNVLVHGQGTTYGSIKNCRGSGGRDSLPFFDLKSGGFLRMEDHFWNGSNSAYLVGQTDPDHGFDGLYINQVHGEQWNRYLSIDSDGSYIVNANWVGSMMDRFQHAVYIASEGVSRKILFMGNQFLAGAAPPAGAVHHVGAYVRGSNTERLRFVGNEFLRAGPAVIVADGSNIQVTGNSFYDCCGSAGANAVVNGTFASAATWSAGTGWVITGGVAAHSSGTAVLVQPYRVYPGDTYATSFAVSGRTAGSVTLRLRRGSSSSVTISQASPGVVTWTTHGLKEDVCVVFSTTGSLPTGLSPDTPYFVKHVLTANTFTVAATVAGTAINTTGAGSGTHQAATAEVVTISHGSPGVVTWPSHGLAVDAPVVFHTTGSLPTGLTAGTTYFVRTVPTGSTFTVSATVGGTEINTTSAGSGTHAGISVQPGTTRSTNATHTETLTSLGIYQTLEFLPTADFDGSLDTVSMIWNQDDRLIRMAGTGHINGNDSTSANATTPDCAISWEGSSVPDSRDAGNNLWDGIAVADEMGAR